MQNRIVTALAARLEAYIPLSKSRLETLCLLVVGAIGARTVNLGHVATERGGRVRPASTYRRLQRFFQFFALAPDWAAPLLSATLGTERWTLVLDRTNWKIGRAEVNYLVLAAVTRRRRVPLLWTLLPHGGGSASADRIALMRRYLAHFPVASICILLGDRRRVAEVPEIIDGCKARMKFVQYHLQANVDRESSLKYLKQTYEKLLTGVAEEYSPRDRGGRRGERGELIEHALTFRPSARSRPQ
jgi:hypothetical protein